VADCALGLASAEEEGLRQIAAAARRPLNQAEVVKMVPPRGCPSHQIHEVRPVRVSPSTAGSSLTLAARLVYLAAFVHASDQPFYDRLEPCRIGLHDEWMVRMGDLVPQSP
jgi:hypothetical protein